MVEFIKLFKPLYQLVNSMRGEGKFVGGGVQWVQAAHSGTNLSMQRANISDNTEVAFSASRAQSPSGMLRENMNMLHIVGVLTSKEHI